MTTELRNRNPNPNSTEKTEESKQNEEKILPKVETSQERWQKIKTRSIFGAFMILFFIGVLNSNHYVICTFVFGLQVMVFREILQVRYNEAKQRKLWMYRSLQWFMFLGSFYWIQFPKTVPHVRNLFPWVSILLEYHMAICFSIYVVAFVLFILQLRGKVLKYQLGQLTWTLMTILLLQQSGHAISNTLKGIFWFLMPSMLIITNDIMAYFCGLAFGRKFIKKSLTSLSPNKTWEGFIGAFIFTTAIAFFMSSWLSNSQWLICPKTTENTTNPGFFYNLECNPHYVFIPREYTLPHLFSQIFGLNSVTLRPIQLHSLLFSVFASLIAPFGGFFASAIKRAYNIKDFNSLFPGHGGIMDRMDCQLIMSLFTHVYYSTFIDHASDVSKILGLISSMSREDQVKLFGALNETISNRIKL